MMANQIAQFFKSYPARRGGAGIASRIEAFWAPKMIATFKAGMGESDRKVHPLVLEALSPDVEARDPAEKADPGAGQGRRAGAVDAG